MTRKKQSVLIKALSDVNDPLFMRVNNFLAVLTIVSVLGIVLETVPELEPYASFFVAVEWITVFFFTLEYISRVYIAPRKLKYVFSFFGLIDLLAIIPTFLGLSNLTFLKTARTLRILRLLRMVRLVKVARTLTLPKKDRKKAADRLNMKIYFMTLLVAGLICGSLIYVIEDGAQNFTSIPEGFFWAMQILLADPSFAKPATFWGEALVLVARFISLLLFGLLINVVGGLLKKVMFGTETLE